MKPSKKTMALVGAVVASVMALATAFGHGPMAESYKAAICGAAE
jgi:hypothetical protein